MRNLMLVVVLLIAASILGCGGSRKMNCGNNGLSRGVGHDSSLQTLILPRW